MQISMNFDMKQFNKMIGVLQKEPMELKKGVVSAINKTATATNTKLQKEITQKYNIKKSELGGGKKYKSEKSNNLIKVNKASVVKLDASIYIRGSSLTLSRFLQKPKNPVSHKGKNFFQIKAIPTPTVQVMKGGAKRITSSRAFVARGNGGIVGIFERKNGKMSMLHTLSTAQMAGNKEVLRAVEQEANQILEKKIEQELNYRVNKLIGGAK